jgi:integrase
LLLSRTGLRLGEAFGLQWQDIDFQAREIRVARAFSEGRLDTPKSGHGRTVDMSQQLAARLARLLLERKAETLKRGWREMPPWVFCTRTAAPLNKGNVRRVFVRVLKRAKLPRHFSPHSLRHSYASLLLQQGEVPSMSSASSATLRSSSPWTRTGSGCPWATKPPWIGSTTEVVAKW